MRRRAFITLLGGAAPWPLAARAQQSRKLFKIGFLSSYTAEAGKDLVGCFRKGLEELGWIDGKNISIEFRWAQGRAEQYPVLAAELVHLDLDLIAANSTPAAQALQRATRDIPVVFMSVSDPVASGIVKGLARPEANITGVSNFLPATSGKLLELLKSVAPNASRVVVLRDPDNAGKSLEVRELQASGPVLGLAIEVMDVRNVEEIAGAFAAIGHGPTALVTLADGVTILQPQADRRACGQTSTPRHLSGEGLRRCGRAHVLWPELLPALSTRRQIRGQNLEGCQARRLAGGIADDLRADHQPHCRQRYRRCDIGVLSDARRRGDRIGLLFLLRCISPQVAHLGSAGERGAFPVLGAKLTSRVLGATAAHDPNRTVRLNSQIGIYGISRDRKLLRLDVGSSDDFRSTSRLPRLMSLPNSTGVIGIPMPPSLASRALTLGSARPALISLLSFSTISAGVFLGAPTPNQLLAS